MGEKHSSTAEPRYSMVCPTNIDNLSDPSEGYTKVILSLNNADSYLSILFFTMGGEGQAPNCYHYLPNHQLWHARWKLSRSTHTLHTHFCTFGADLCAQSVLSNKISASELRRKFIKSALLVGMPILVGSRHKKSSSPQPPPPPPPPPQPPPPPPPPPSPDAHRGEVRAHLPPAVQD